MTNRSHALIVTDDLGLARHWDRWLQEGGYETALCTGPGSPPDCPRIEGRPCHLREWADVAVVESSAPGAKELMFGWPRRTCSPTEEGEGTLFVVPAGRPLPGAAPKVHHPVTRHGLLSNLHRTFWGLPAED